TLKKAAANELAGPCPKCAGRDRFSVNIKKQVFNCRGCEVGRDVIALAQLIYGCDFAEAVEHVTADRRGDPRKANGKRSGGRSQGDSARTVERKTTAAKPVVDRNSAKSFDYVDAGGALLYRNVRLPLVNSDGSPAMSRKGKQDKTFE